MFIRRLSQRCKIWGFNSGGVEGSYLPGCCTVIRQVVPGVSRAIMPPSAGSSHHLWPSTTCLNFSHDHSFCSSWPWRWRHYSPSKQQELLIQQVSHPRRLKPTSCWPHAYVHCFYCLVLVQNLLPIEICSAEGNEHQSLRIPWQFPLQLRVSFTDLPFLRLKMSFPISCFRIMDLKMFFIPMVVMLDHFSVWCYTARSTLVNVI